MIHRGPFERRGELGFDSAKKSRAASDRGRVLADTSKARRALPLSLAAFNIIMVLSNGYETLVMRPTTTQHLPV